MPRKKLHELDMEWVYGVQWRLRKKIIFEKIRAAKEIFRYEHTLWQKYVNSKEPEGNKMESFKPGEKVDYIEGASKYGKKKIGYNRNIRMNIIFQKEDK